MIASAHDLLLQSPHHRHAGQASAKVMRSYIIN